MKKFFVIIFMLTLVGLLVTGGWLMSVIGSSGNSGPLPETKIVLIERGKGVSAIGDILEAEQVVRSSLIFKIIVKLQADPRPLKAGEYEFPQYVSMDDALEMMREGKVYDRKITLPEGVTSWQVVQAVNALSDMSGEVAEVPPEGALLPETYHYIKNDDRAELLNKMKEAMDKTVAELWPLREADSPIKDERELLVLASIVEKETGVASERAKVAGVFINRLNKGMPLQSDPTVIYGITKGEIKNEGQGPIGRRLLTKDLERDTPYNTYMNPGLPPTPIANPGRASIEAVLKPEKHDFIYFVADGTGGHVFARTLSEHNTNVARWRKIRKSR